jgi:hypothetical protein
MFEVITIEEGLVVSEYQDEASFIQSLEGESLDVLRAFFAFRSKFN